MFKNKDIAKVIRYSVEGLPLAAIIFASFLPLQPIVRHLLVLAVLVWVQVFMIFEVFSNKS
jgi:hypothetical protein